MLKAQKWSDVKTAWPEQSRSPVLSPKYGETFISTPIMKASFVEALLVMFGVTPIGTTGIFLTFLVTQELHVQGPSHCRRYPKTRIIF